MEKVNDDLYRTKSGIAVTGEEIRKMRENAGKEQGRTESGLALTRGEMKSIKRETRKGKR
jgi:tmRNA-binding protein